MTDHKRRKDDNNGNGKSDVAGKIAKELGGFAVAELTSIGASWGVYTFIDELAPKTMKAVSSVVAKVCIEPFLDKIESGLRICKSHDCKPDMNKSRHERAQQYAHFLTRFVVSAGAGVVTELAVRQISNKLSGLEPVKHRAGWVPKWVPDSVANWIPKKHDAIVVGLDKGSQLGAIIAINHTFADKSDTLLAETSNLLQKTLGWSKERADKSADVTVRWEIPNVFSYVLTSGYIAGRHLLGKGGNGHSPGKH